MTSEMRYSSTTGMDPVHYEIPELPSDIVEPSRCGCGKVGWPDERSARDVVVRAKCAAALRGNRNRREKTVYRCPHNDLEVWHTTSQAPRPTWQRPAVSPAVPEPVVEPEPEQPRSDYLPDDDESARDFLEHAIHYADDAPWEALLGPMYCGQTLRVLLTWRTALDEDIAERAQAAKTSGSGRELARHREYTRTLYPVREQLNDRIRAAREACGMKAKPPKAKNGGGRTPGPDSVRWLRTRVHAARTEAHEAYWRAVARRLAMTIAEHRERHGADADPALWEALERTMTPRGSWDKNPPRTIASLITSGAWYADDPDNLNGTLWPGITDPDNELDAL